MSTVFWTDRPEVSSIADGALRAATRLWFAVAVTGQLVFAITAAAYYGGAALRGDAAAWNRFMPHGYVPGHTVGNAAVAVHLFLGVLIILGGAIQLVPQVREHAPSFHRWNGRIYVLAACTVSIAALHMIWIRGAVGNMAQRVGISLNALLIILCAVLVVRYALVHRFTVHRRWALRLFLAVSGVWFFRVGLMLWVFLDRGPARFDPRAFQAQWAANSGGSPELVPFITVLSFAQYLLPLAVLELYLRTQDRAGAKGRLVMAATLLVLTVAMAIGVFAATIGMWLPRL